MGRVSIVFFLLLLDWEAAAHVPQATDAAKTQSSEKCTVAGTVVRLDSGAVLKKATVVLRSPEGGGKSVFAITDDQGRFQFDNVEPGSYGLDASHNGFVTLLYGQKKPDSPGATLTLAPGQKMTDLVFKLLRSASISGHVMDEDGEPLPYVQVRPYQRSSRRGRSGLGAVGEVLTNDLGEYRIFDLNPGRYYIRATYSPQRNLWGEGAVVTGDSLPAAGVYVVAIPDAPHRDQQWKYRSETTDQNGKFLLRGIVPGEYRIFSWDSRDDFDWYNADQLKPYESKGVPVSVQEGDRKTMQLTAIQLENNPQPIR